MSRVLDLLAVPATRAPRSSLAGLLVLTMLLALAATQLEVSTDLDDFAPEGGLNDAMRDIDERFGAGEGFQVLVDAGPGGDVLGPAALRAGVDLSEVLEDDPDVAPVLAQDTSRPAVLTYAEPFAVALEDIGLPLADLDDDAAEVLVRTILEDDRLREQIRPLLANDLDLESPSARAGLATITLESGLADHEVERASHAVDEALGEVDAPGLRLSLISDTVMEQAMEDGLMRDLPLLMGLSLLLVVLVLAWLYRRVSDVLIGVGGLLASIVWMAGIGAVLGPGVLGVMGPFGQISIAVPVLLVGLGVDYSVHLTTRYREQQARGDSPSRAASTALRTVGVALVLATLATVGGFLANLATPLPPIADLGIFAAAGIISAFVILSLAVPAARVLLDRRREPDGGRPSPDPTDRAQAEPGGRVAPLAATGAALATRRGVPVLLVSGMLVVVAAVAASGLGTEFDDRSFLPSGSPVSVLVDRSDRLFGGDVGDQTFVLIDGDVSDPRLLATGRAFERDLAEVGGVRTVGDRAQVTSPFEIVRRLGESGDQAREQLASDLDAWRDPDAAAEAVPLPDELDPELLEAAVDDGQDTVELPTDLRDAIARRLPDGRSPSVALAAAGDPQDLRANVREGLRDDLVADRPDALADGPLASLAALEPAALTLDRLEAEGFPLDVLADPDREALATADELEAAGWDTDQPASGPDAVEAQLAVAAQHEPDELDAFLADDGLLLVVAADVSTERAEAMAAQIETMSEPVAQAGGTVTVVSQRLVSNEIADELSDAQLLAIIISVLVAALLLVVATWLSERSIVLGLIGAAPAACALVLVLGSMRALGMTFNALTATVASIAVGIGVPYGIHLTNRFRVSMREIGTVDGAIHDSLRHTGGALIGSAVTTGLAFGVLGLSASTPLRQFGAVSAMMIVYALVACLVIQPALLVLWARRRTRRRHRHEDRTGDEHRVADGQDGVAVSGSATPR